MTRQTPISEEAPPDFLTVEEAAVVSRIGRTAAYRLARQFLATNGGAGLPVVRFGKQLRVPRCKLEELLGGHITWPIQVDAPAPQVSSPTPVAASRRRASRSEPEPRLFSA